MAWLGIIIISLSLNSSKTSPNLRSSTSEISLCALKFLSQHFSGIIFSTCFGFILPFCTSAPYFPVQVFEQKYPVLSLSGRVLCVILLPLIVNSFPQYVHLTITSLLYTASSLQCFFLSITLRLDRLLFNGFLSIWSTVSFSESFLFRYFFHQIFRIRNTFCFSCSS